MKVCHLFVTVNDDGMGDFSHFVDIYTALMKDSDLNKMEFIPVVFVEGHDKEKLKKINAKLSSLNIPRYFSGHSTAFEEPSQNHKDLIDTLKKSDQILFISYDSLYRRYQNNINPNTILKTINEHEGRVSLHVPNSRKRSMGLAEDCYGLKISEFTHPSSSEASSIIAEHDPNFLSDLLRHTGSETFEDFTKNNTLAPAYFNITFDFKRFLTFLVTQDLDKKDLALYFSGAALNSEESDLAAIVLPSIAKSRNVRVELIKKNSEPIVYNPSATRVIRVFTEYNISDPSYRALYSNAKIAGVSGDNTLEYAIAHNVFPFYMSTNFSGKKHTLWGLQKISQLAELPISDEARRSFDIYFNPDYYLHSLSKLPPVNLSAMIDAWPHIASYIKTHKNFYSKLKGILLEGLSEKVLDTSSEVEVSGNKSSRPSNPSKPNEDSKTNSSSLININMQVLGGFMAVIGCAEVATAFTLLNAATFGTLGLAVAGLGAASALVGIGVFATSTYKNRQTSPLESLDSSAALAY